MLLKLKNSQWFAIVFIIRLLFFIYFAYCYNYYGGFNITNYLFVQAGDTQKYFIPLDNFMNQIGYGFIVNNEYKPCGYMPGIAPLYIPFLFVFSADTAKISFILIQFLLSVISVIALAKISEYLFKSRKVFVITTLLYTFSGFVFIYDNIGLTDSLHASLLIFSLYFFVQYLKTYKLKWIFISGVFIAWGIFIRPVVGPCLLFFPLIILIKQIQEKRFVWNTYIVTVILFGLPFVALDSLWIARNYKVYNKLYPLHLPLYEMDLGAYPPHRIAATDFITAEGEDLTHWVDGSMGEWFISNRDNGFDVNRLKFTSKFNADSILNLRMYFDLSMRGKALSEQEKEKYARLTSDLSKKYKKSIRQEKPFYYYVTSRVKMLYYFLCPKQYSSPLPFPPLHKMNIIQKALKGGWFLSFYFVQLLAYLGMILSWKKNKFNLLFTTIPFFIIFSLTFVVGYSEIRYFIPIYVMFLPFTAFAIDQMITKLPRLTRIMH